jgi:hypothetical protein
MDIHLKFYPHCAERSKKMATGNYWEANHFVEEVKRKGPPLGSGPFQDAWICQKVFSYPLINLGSIKWW